MAFATYEDLRERWPQLDAAEDAGTASSLLEDASLWVATMYTLPDPVGQKLAGVLRLIVCAMVKRSLQAMASGNLTSLSHAAGPFSQQVSYSNAEGNFYLTSAEKDLLTAALDGDTGTQGMASVEAVGW